MIAEAHTFTKKKQAIVVPKITWVRIVVFALLALQFLPYLFLWDEAYIRIHDTLEGIDYQLLFKSGNIFNYSADATVPQILNGQLRMAMKTGWSFVALWQGLFGLYAGYILNYVIVHLVAFAGMYLLLHRHILNGPSKTHVALSVALCFSWIPVFSMLGLSVAGMPLLGWAFLNLLAERPSGRGWQSWAVITLFPFYSDIVWAGMPVLLFAGGFLLYRFWAKGQWPWFYIAACGWLAIVYAAVNWQLVQITFFDTSFVSHRAEYDYFYNKKLSLGQSLKDTLQILLISHHHTGILVSVPIVMAMARSGTKTSIPSRSLKIGILILVIGLFYGCYNWLVWLGEDYFPLLKSFKFERIISLLPTLWMVFFALALDRLSHRLALQGTVTLLLAGQFMMGVFANDEFLHNIRQMAGQPQKPNFRAFFDPALFSNIDRHIGLPKNQYRVISLGMHPSVAQYNGFYTLDCHASIYSLNYKHRFRQIVAGELEKNRVIRNEFDHFGNRCYLYSAELGKEYDAFLCGKTKAKKVKNLSLDTSALCSMGGCYLLSAVEILSAGETGLHLSKVFEGKFWRVYLYKIETKPIVLKKAIPMWVKPKSLRITKHLESLNDEPCVKN